MVSLSQSQTSVFTCLALTQQHHNNNTRPFYTANAVSSLSRQQIKTLGTPLGGLGPSVFLFFGLIIHWANTCMLPPALPLPAMQAYLGLILHNQIEPGDTLWVWDPLVPFFSICFYSTLAMHTPSCPLTHTPSHTKYNHAPYTHIANVEDAEMRFHVPATSSVGT